MRIGVDVDGVLTKLDEFQFDYFSKFCVENNIDYEIGESSYEVEHTFGLTPEEGNKFWDEYLSIYESEVQMRAFAAEVVKKLKDDGHEIYIITARWGSNRDDEVGKRARKVVLDWLEKNGVIYDNLVFSKGSGDRKKDEITGNKIDLMIEDSPTNIEELSKFTNVICFDASYNRECQGSNITRCYSWYDVYNTIRKFDD